MSDIELSIIYLTFDRDEPVRHALGALPTSVRENPEVEIVLVDNNADGVDRSGLLDGFANGVYVQAEKNLGCASGRNAGFAASSGTYLLFVDDDAEVMTADPVQLARELFEADERRGIVASKSIDASGQLRRHEFPHSDKTRNPDSAFDTFRYIGVCHLMRRAMVEEIGLYDDEFFFFSEEFDLAFKALSAGWRIRYDPRLEVVHRHADSGRLARAEAQMMLYLNRLKISWRYIPMPHMVGYSAAYAGLHLRNTKRPLDTARGLRDGVRWVLANRSERRPLPRQARREIAAAGGTLWR